MRKLLLFVISTFALSQAFAAKSVFIDYKCVAPDQVSVNKLEMSGEAELFAHNNEFTDNEISLKLIEAGNLGEILTYSMSISGKIRHFPAGQLATNEVFQVQSVDKYRNVKVVNILIGHPGTQSSYVRLRDGREFRGRCAFVINN